MRLLSAVFLLASSLMVTGCGLLPDAPETEYEGKTAAQLYAMGLSYRRGSDFTKAIETFEYLESGYPFDPYAQQGLLEMAYSQYRQEEYTEAIVVLDRFIEQNPLHTHIAYAHYMRGVIYLDYGRTLLHYVLPYIRHNKDPTPWLLAFTNFSLVVTKYPESRYAVDARQHTIFLRNLLARYELHVADFYLRRKAYVAVVNRSKQALARYHGAPNMDDMLWYLEQGYRHMEMHQLADDVRSVRDLNFPGYEARKAAEEKEPTWLSETGEWLSDTVDSAAIMVGFDIEEFPPPDFSGKYQRVALNLGEAEEFVASHEPDKVVVSEVPSGHIPTSDIDSEDLWYQLRQLLSLSDDKELPSAPGDTPEPVVSSETPETPAEESTPTPAPSN
ncbi:MAG: outer membrane protein assembly factor BamD [Gammaproteobacteria bacterium]|nr:outer membrane protein assembly factor BamD [Gammaproteobacteria bacterium]